MFVILFNQQDNLKQKVLNTQQWSSVEDNLKQQEYVTKNLNEFKINFSATNSVHQPYNIDNFHQVRMYSTIVENSSIF